MIEPNNQSANVTQDQQTGSNKMNLSQLLPITETTEPNINARDLYKALNIGRDFSNWIKARLNQAHFIENQDYKAVHILTVDTPKLANQKGGDKRSINYLLSLDTAKHICLMERNNPIAHEIRQYFIDSEKALQKHAPTTAKALTARASARIATIAPQTRLNDAIAKWEQRHGKAKKAHHYSKESELINSATLGENVRKWKQAKGFTDCPRNHFTRGQLELLARLAELNSAMIELDIDYSERKARLFSYADNYRLERE